MYQKIENIYLFINKNMSIKKFAVYQFNTSFSQFGKDMYFGEIETYIGEKLQNKI